MESTGIHLEKAFCPEKRNSPGQPGMNKSKKGHLKASIGMGGKKGGRTRGTSPKKCFSKSASSGASP